MPSGKQSRRQRAAARVPAPPKAPGTERRRASPRVLAVAAGVLVLIVVGIVLAIVLTRGSGSSSTGQTVGSLTNALPGAADVEDLFKGMPQNGNVLGDSSAPVTIIEYIDLQCPFCAEFETQALEQLISRVIRPGKAKLEARMIAFIGPDSARGRAAAIAAGQQSKLFNFTQLLYTNQGPENSGWLDDSLIEAAAASIPGIAVQEVMSARSSAAVEQQANSWEAEATQNKVTSTPTIYVGKSGAAPERLTLNTASDWQTVVDAVNAAAA